jgi:uncharacterized protein
MIVLSHVQAEALLAARKEAAAGLDISAMSLDISAVSLDISLDLNKSKTVVSLTETGVTLLEEITLTWEEIAEIADHTATSFIVYPNGAIEKIQFFSEETRRVCSLRPTLTGAPTLWLAGFPMHRIKNTDPWSDTEAKIATLAPISGRVLDTATGLGYTTILAARSALSVTTIEIDPAVLDVCKRNPWSQELFSNPRITSKLGDSYEVIQTFTVGEFQFLFHDPPTIQLAGDLYSGTFYKECFRVLAKKGKMFHYIGDPESRQGSSLTKGVIKRLREAGFVKVTLAPEAFGVVAFK